MRIALLVLLLGPLAACGGPPPPPSPDARPPPPPEWQSRQEADRPTFNLENEMTPEEAEAAGLVPPEADEEAAAE